MPGSLVVVNPHASKGRDASTLAALTERLEVVLGARDGATPRLVETPSPEAVAPLVSEAVDEGMAAVIGVGGDGTMREIATALTGTDVPLGVIPAGTGNQIAAAMGIPRSPVEALDLLAHAEPRRIDLGEVTVRDADGTATTMPFIIGCGLGFDAELMATTSATLKRRLGAAAYFVQGARLALRVSATPCRLTVDDHVIETPAAIVLIGNMGHLVPGRLDLRLPLDPADGLLELIVVEARNPLRGAHGLINQLRRTELGESDGSIRLRGRHISVEPVTPLPLEVDGDHLGSGSLHARVIPDALPVLVPSG